MAVPMPCNDIQQEDARPASRIYILAVFFLTFGLMLSDYMSRQVINAVFPSLKAEWALSDAQLGSLVGIVALIVGVMSFPVSVLADRWGRVRSVTAMALVWGIATIACGLSGNFVAMLIARAFVGMGEAGYGSVGGAILLSVFPRRYHSTVVGAFLAAAMFGSVLGVMVGGILAHHFGWRIAFLAVGAGGLILALLYPMVVREPQRKRRDTTGESRPLKRVLREVLETPTSRWTYVGSGLQMFIQGAVIAWIPSYLNRYHAMDMAQAASMAGVLVLLAGIGMAFGGVLVDQFAKRDQRNKLRVPMAYALLSAMILLLAFNLTQGTTQLVLIGLGMLVGAGFAGPSGAVIGDVSRASIHATAMATLVLANNIIGLAPGPFIAGLLADAFSLHLAMALVPLAGLGSAWAYFKASHHYPGDVKPLHLDD